MTKLVIYTENYFPGGLEQFIFDILKSNLFDIHLVVNSENNRLIEFAINNDINHSIINLNNKSFGANSSKFFKFFNFIMRYIYMLPNYYKIKSILKSIPSFKNILIVNGGYPAALSCFSAVVAANSLHFEKIGLSILSSPSSNYSSVLFRMFEQRIDHFIDRYVDIYIPNSNRIKLDLIEKVKIKSEKIETVYTGIEIKNDTNKIVVLSLPQIEIQKKENEVWIGMIALLGSTKRQDLLITAMAQLDDNVKLLITGDGPTNDDLRNQVKLLNLESRVFFTGWIDNPEIIYKFIDIIAFMSDQEGLPYSISEAMSYKVPIIASAVGGIVEQVIDEKGGFLIHENSIIKLVEKIKILQNNNELQNEFIEYSFRRLNKLFSLEAMNNRLVEIYAEG